MFFSFQGASIIRMLQFFLGRKVFLQGLTVSITSSFLRVGELFNLACVDLLSGNHNPVVALRKIHITASSCTS